MWERRPPSARRCRVCHAIRPVRVPRRPPRAVCGRRRRATRLPAGAARTSRGSCLAPGPSVFDRKAAELAVEKRAQRRLERLLPRIGGKPTASAEERRGQRRHGVRSLPAHHAVHPTPARITAAHTRQTAETGTWSPKTAPASSAIPGRSPTDGIPKARARGGAGSERVDRRSYGRRWQELQCMGGRDCAVFAGSRTVTRRSEACALRPDSRAR